ncbi:hypothetical protein MLD38_007495 [Melastoma candidum]|uniref:Uncharacterized protein n=1 Tax=Melastoma candidum TaxID=119954 RepID=A0ACB9RV19_9MYRT|nr:hypothetical protein MLD38_007495 [Melastoma candidum]
MHQCHLGTEEDEKDGEYVISKILFQQQQLKQGEKGEHDAAERTDVTITKADPATPKSISPDPPRNERLALSDLVANYMIGLISTHSVEMLNENAEVEVALDVEVPPEIEAALDVEVLQRLKSLLRLRQCKPIVTCNFETKLIGMKMWMTLITMFRITLNGGIVSHRTSWILSSSWWGYLCVMNSSQVSRLIEMEAGTTKT